MEILAERLKELRKERNKTQKEIADFLGIKEQSYQKYEYRTHIPRVDILKKIADYYNVSTDYLLGRKDRQT